MVDDRGATSTGEPPMGRVSWDRFRGALSSLEAISNDSARSIALVGSLMASWRQPRSKTDALSDQAWHRDDGHHADGGRPQTGYRSFPHSAESRHRRPYCRIGDVPPGEFRSLRTTLFSLCRDNRAAKKRTGACIGVA